MSKPRACVCVCSAEEEGLACEAPGKLFLPRKSSRQVCVWGGGVPGRKECQAARSAALTFIRPVVTCKRVIWAAASAAWSSVLASTLLSLPRPASSAVSSPTPTPAVPK